MYFHPSTTRSRGFSLIELAVALVIVMTLLTLGITAITVQMENTALSVTRKKQDTIKDALSAYLGKYKRLPCPDILDAVGNIVGRGDDNRATAEDVATQCSKDFGVVPYIDLGLPRDIALDGWENYFTYRVTTDATTALDWTRSGSFAVAKPGKLVVSERSPATSAVLVPLTNPVTENAVVVLVSHGKNGLGAWTVQGTRNVLPDAVANSDERENADDATNLLFIRREITGIAVPTYGPYDDIVAFMKASDLVAPFAKDGTLKTPEAETVQAMTTAINAIIGASSATGGALPDPALYTMPVDGWGRPLVYTRVTSPILLSTVAADAFKVTSYGPDGALGGTDDVTSTITVDVLRGLYVRAGVTLGP